MLPLGLLALVSLCSTRTAGPGPLRGTAMVPGQGRPSPSLLPTTARPSLAMGLTLSRLHHSRSLQCSSPSAFTTTSTEWDRDRSRALGAAEDTAFPHPSELSSSLSFITSQALGTLPSPVSAPEVGLAHFSGSRDRTQVKFPAGNLQSKRPSTSLAPAAICSQPSFLDPWKHRELSSLAQSSGAPHPAHHIADIPALPHPSTP